MTQTITQTMNSTEITIKKGFWFQKSQLHKSIYSFLVAFSPEHPQVPEEKPQTVGRGQC